MYGLLKRRDAGQKKTQSSQVALVRIEMGTEASGLGVGEVVGSGFNRSLSRQGTWNKTRKEGRGEPEDVDGKGPQVVKGNSSKERIEGLG